MSGEPEAASGVVIIKKAPRLLHLGATHTPND